MTEVLEWATGEERQDIPMLRQGYPNRVSWGHEMLPGRNDSPASLRSSLSMKRSLIVIPSLLALAVGAWYMSSDSGTAAAPEPVTPHAKADQVKEPEEALPLLDQLRRAEASLKEERTQGVLNKPQLFLLTRRAADGDELPGAQITIDPLQAEDQDSSILLEPSATATAATELDPGAWRVTFEAEGYVSQTREVDLELGDEEHLEVSLVRGAQITGSAQDRFGQRLTGQKLFFLAPGQVHPRFARDAEGILTTSIDREGNIVPITIPPDMYTVTYGNLGTPKLKTEGRVNAGEDAELSIVFGGRSMIRFELDTIPEGERRLEVRLEEVDEKKLARDQERLQRNPERAGKDRGKGKSREHWRSRGRAQIRGGVADIHRASPGTYRVTLVARPGEYSSEPILVLKEDESVLVKVQTPALPARAGNRKGDPKLPKNGPLNITIVKNPQDPNMKENGMYWR